MAAWLWLACLCCSSLAAPAAPLLLIVGSVTTSGARILLDQLIDGERLLVSVHGAEDGALVQQRTLQPKTGKRPQIVQVGDLQPDQQYRVTFHRAAGSETRDHRIENAVRFRTAPVSSAQLATRILVHSCDRWIDDHDDALWEQLARDAETSRSYFGMVHHGDQVYVDAGSGRVPIVPVHIDQRDSDQLRDRYASVVSQFRSIYRQTFGRPEAQRVLRLGAHWMLPDDHEVINNINYECVQRVLSASDDESTGMALAWMLHYRAGMQVMYEYQVQLQQDIDWDDVDFLLDPLSALLHRYPLFYKVEISRLKLFLLDLRFDRALLDVNEDHSRLISARQNATLTGSLAYWAEDAQNAVAVISNMPLFFHSRLSAAMAYAVEQDTYPGLSAQHVGLMDLYLLFQQYQSTILRLLVGGDVHMLAHSKVCSMGITSNQSRLGLDQLITSGSTNGSTAMLDIKLVLFYFVITRITPIIELLVTTPWAWCTEQTQWRVTFDRVFLGRNYGYAVAFARAYRGHYWLTLCCRFMELSPEGHFEWGSVTVAHDQAVHKAIQVCFMIYFAAGGL